MTIQQPFAALSPEDCMIVQCPSCGGYGWRAPKGKRVQCSFCNGLATVTAAVERTFDWSKAATCDEWAPPRGRRDDGEFPPRPRVALPAAATRPTRDRSGQDEPTERPPPSPPPPPSSPHVPYVGSPDYRAMRSPPVKTAEDPLAIARAAAKVAAATVVEAQAELARQDNERDPQTYAWGMGTVVGILTRALRVAKAAATLAEEARRGATPAS